MFKIAASLFLAGLLLGAGPCVASCGPFLVTYVAGTRKNIPESVAAYAVFSLSRVLIYIVLALAIFFLSRVAIEGLLSGLYKYVLISGGVFIMIIGLFMAIGKRFESKFCQPLYKNLLERDKKSVFIAGLVIGLLPCAPLISVLSYIGLISRTWFLSLLYSLSFGIGTIVSPLVLLVVMASVIPRVLLNKTAAYFRVFSFSCGLIIMLLGAQLIMRAF
jgi:sulfite exporter TauE/SafE